LFGAVSWLHYLKIQLKALEVVFRFVVPGPFLDHRNGSPNPDKAILLRSTINRPEKLLRQNNS